MTFFHVHLGYQQKGICRVAIDENHLGNYFIYFENPKTNQRIPFGQLNWKMSDLDENLYSIRLGEKIYQLTSSDLRNRRLTIVDMNKNSDRFHPENLLQVNDLFSKSNKILHLTINDEEQAFGYLSIVILLHILESKRM